MSSLSPLIADWIARGLKWSWYWKPITKPFQLAPKEKRKVPSSDYTFKGAEGVLVQMSAYFDSPYGGISMKTEPEYDVGGDNTILNNLLAGLTRPNAITWCVAPPLTPYYGIHSFKEWPALEWCELYVLNSDPVNSITCLGYAYHFALLKSRELRPSKAEEK